MPAGSSSTTSSPGAVGAAPVVAVASDAGKPSWARLGGTLAAAARSSHPAAVEAVLKALLTQMGGDAALRLVRGETQWTVGEHTAPRPFNLEPLLPALGAAARTADAQRGVVSFVAAHADRSFAVVVAPILESEAPTSVLAVIAPHEARRHESFLLAPQLAAACLAQQALHDTAQEARHAAQASSAIVDLVQRAQRATSLDEAAAGVVEKLREFLSARHVALGWTSRPGAGCALRALSELRRFDPHAELSRAYEAALEEICRRNEPVAWRADEASAGPPPKSLERLAALTGCRQILGNQVRVGDVSRGSILILDPQPAAHGSSQQRFLTAAGPLLGAALKLVADGSPGPVRSFFARHWPRGRGRRNALFALAAACVGALAIPWPHRISVPFTVEPLERRFVAAPFDGVLERSLVTPGDAVTAGQPLALLDGRELRWELSGVEAERGRAEKQRDVALARREAAAMQQAQLELQRLDLKCELLTHRIAHLEVRSPLAGIVVSGDLSKAQHAPLESGQKLFEIAPLDGMLAELAVPEADVAYVEQGLTARMTFDAWTGEAWSGEVVRVRPRAETRDGESVFIAEIGLDNPRSALRPGMQGTATITGPRRALGWILFHKPAEALARILGW